MILIDLELKDPEIFYLVERESKKQIEKWGIQSRSPFEWMCYATEEVGETAAAISEHYYRSGGKAAVVKEAIQAATLFLKIAEMYRNL